VNAVCAHGAHDRGRKESSTRLYTTNDLRDGLDAFLMRFASCANSLSVPRRTLQPVRARRRPRHRKCQISWQRNGDAAVLCLDLHHRVRQVPLESTVYSGCTAARSNSRLIRNFPLWIARCATTITRLRRC